MVITTVYRLYLFSLQTIFSLERNKMKKHPITPNPVNIKIHLGKIWESVNVFAFTNKTPALNSKYRIEGTGMFFIYLY
jgi:hypothetical protein